MIRKFLSRIQCQLAVFFTVLVCSPAVFASETVVHQFIPWAAGSGPVGLVQDAQGNFYGATVAGGTFDRGTVFKLTRGSNGQWNETVLYNFGGYAADGTGPFSGVVLDASGNIYGTTDSGGTEGFGTVFEVSPLADGTWSEKILYSFQGTPSDGLYPDNGVVLDAAGNLFGTTATGGSNTCGDANGCGIVYEVSPASDGAWTEKLIYSFQSVSSYPSGNLVFDGAGNLYGVTFQPLGAVFELSPSSGGWSFNILHTFGSGNDGRFPNGITLDAAGNIFGTTLNGGPIGYGVFYELQRGAGGWHENILYEFGAGSPGYWPNTALVRDSLGNFYGATTFSFGRQPQLQGNGTIFEFSPSAGGAWTVKTLYLFQGGSDGSGGVGLTLGSDGNLYGLSNGGVSQAGAVFSLAPGSGERFVEKQIYVFPSTDGAVPSGLVADASGNFYGVTKNEGSGGGGIECISSGGGCGTIFQLSRSSHSSWQENVLYNFTGVGADGALPADNLILDSAGNLYGTTPSGGIAGGGTAFKLSPPSPSSGTWTETILHSFGALPPNGGSQPYGGLVFDVAGNLYGTTLSGGSYGPYNGCGTVYELTPHSNGSWSESVLYSFQGNGDGCGPTTSLAIDSAGNLYGTTGGYDGSKEDVAFRLLRSASGRWVETVLHTFTNQPDGWEPAGAPILDAAGNLYGVLQRGGAYDFGAIYKISPTSGGGWTETILYSFGASLTDGLNPVGNLVFDRAGNLYGTTMHGGSDISSTCTFENEPYCGTVFRLSPTSTGEWTESILHDFTGVPLDGAYPNAGVVLDSAGNVFGVASGGGIGYNGVVFEITP